MKRILIVAVLMLLSACGTLVPPSGPPQSLNYHDDISLAGRLSVSFQQDGKARSVQGKFSWTQTKDQTDIALYSPLGQTMAKIAVAPGLARLQQAGEPVREATDIAELTAQTLGWPMPVAGLREWLQGFAQVGTQRKAAPEGFTREGWTVRYVSWQGEPSDGVGVYPKRIDLRRLSAEAGEIGLRIVIDSWQPE